MKVFSVMLAAAAALLASCTSACPNCHGTGQDGAVVCRFCQGKGHISTYGWSANRAGMPRKAPTEHAPVEEIYINTHNENYNYNYSERHNFNHNYYYD